LSDYLSNFPEVVPGDFNSDGRVDSADYVLWRTTGTPQGYESWRTHFGQTVGGGSGAAASTIIPEPVSTSALVMGLLVMCFRRVRG